VETPKKGETPKKAETPTKPETPKKAKLPDKAQTSIKPQSPLMVDIPKVTETPILEETLENIAEMVNNAGSPKKADVAEEIVSPQKTNSPLKTTGTPIVAKKSPPEVKNNVKSPLISPKLNATETISEIKNAEARSPRRRTPSPTKTTLIISSPINQHSQNSIGLSPTKIELSTDVKDEIIGIHVEAVEPETQPNVIIVNKCGDCPGCLRRVCNECSFCKNGQKSQCIDKYCMNTDEGRRQREEAKAKYLASLSR